MSHEVETIMYSGDVPWHGFGTYVGDKDLDSKHAIKAAGLDWKVKTQPMSFKADIGYGTPSNETVGDPIYQNTEIPNHKAMVRSDNNRVLGVVGNRYKPVQNIEAFEFLDSLVDAGQMKYHTAGSLRDGRNVWLLAKIGSMTIVPKDHVDKYLLLYNSHDGSGAIRCFFTTVRVVCANTSAIALNEGKGTGICLRHTSKVHEHLIEGKQILQLANQEFNQFETFAKHLAKTKMTEKTMIQFAEKMFPSPPAHVKSKRHIAKRSVLVDLFDGGTGQEIFGVNRTYWAAYNALTEFANYYQPARGADAQQRRFEASVFSPTGSLIQKGTQELIKMAA